MDAMQRKAIKIISLLIAVAFLLLLPVLVADAANDIASAIQSNGTAIELSATWTEYQNVSIATGVGNVSVTITVNGQTNYSTATAYGRIKQNGTVIESFNLTKSYTPETVTFVAPIAVAEGTHNFTFEAYCTAGKKCTLYNRTFSVMFIRTGSFAASVTNVTATSPVTSTYGATPNIAMPVSGSSSDGYLDQTNWTRFNNTNGTVAAIRNNETTYITVSNSSHLTNKTVFGSGNTSVTDNSNGTVTISTVVPTYFLTNSSVFPAGNITVTNNNNGTITVSSSVPGYFVTVYNTSYVLTSNRSYVLNTSVFASGGNLTVTDNGNGTLTLSSSVPANYLVNTSVFGSGNITVTNNNNGTISLSVSTPSNYLTNLSIYNAGNLTITDNNNGTLTLKITTPSNYLTNTSVYPNGNITVTDNSNGTLTLRVTIPVNYLLNTSVFGNGNLTVTNNNNGTLTLDVSVPGYYLTEMNNSVAKNYNQSYPRLAISNNTPILYNSTTGVYSLSLPTCTASANRVNSTGSSFVCETDNTSAFSFVVTGGETHTGSVTATAGTGITFTDTGGVWTISSPAAGVTNASVDFQNGNATNLTSGQVDFNLRTKNVTVNGSTNISGLIADANIANSTTWNNKVSSVGATSPCTSTGGQNPTITCTGVSNETMDKNLSNYTNTPIFVTNTTMDKNLSNYSGVVPNASIPLSAANLSANNTFTGTGRTSFTGSIQLYGEQGIYWWNSPNNDNNAMGRIVFQNGSIGGDIGIYVGNVEVVRIEGNNVGICGNSTPVNVLACTVGSATDPIADSWLQYSTPESKIVLGEADNLTEKYRKDFRNTTVYLWKRTANEPERLGALAQNGTPLEILAYHDGKNNTNSTAKNATPQGIDLGAYIGWLHEVVKGQDMQLQVQEQKIASLEVRVQKLENRGILDIMFAKQIDYLYNYLNLTKP